MIDQCMVVTRSGQDIVLEQPRPRPCCLSDHPLQQSSRAGLAAAAACPIQVAPALRSGRRPRLHRLLRCNITFTGRATSTTGEKFTRSNHCLRTLAPSLEACRLYFSLMMGGKGSKLADCHPLPKLAWHTYLVLAVQELAYLKMALHTMAMATLHSHQPSTTLQLCALSRAPSVTISSCNT